MTASRGHRLRRQLVPAAWLVLVWILLWGTWTVANLVSGFLVAVVVLAVLPLPDLALGARLDPRGMVRFLLWFVRELVRSSLQVAWRAVGPEPVRSNAVIAAPLRTRSDAVLTAVAEAQSLIPGSLVLEVDRARWTLYIHVLGATDEADVAAARAAVRELENRVAAAIGGADERRVARAALAGSEPPEVP